MTTDTNPAHYQGTIEPLDAITAWALTWPVAYAFHLGNAIKYIARCGRKGALLGDLRKARTYLDRAIAGLEAAPAPGWYGRAGGVTVGPHTSEAEATAALASRLGWGAGDRHTAEIWRAGEPVEPKAEPKVGDRVRVTAVLPATVDGERVWWPVARVGEAGTLIDTDEGSSHPWAIDGDRGLAWASEVESIEPAQPRPRIGDRVRVTRVCERWDGPSARLGYEGELDSIDNDDGDAHYFVEGEDGAAGWASEVEVIG